MTIFVDTSALYSLLDADEKNHRIAGDTWTIMLKHQQHLVTTNYIIVETCALVHRRLGIEILSRFLGDILPTIMVNWVDPPLHIAGTNAVLLSTKGGPSLADCVSFAVMRQLGIRDAFSFDSHFKDQGFSCRP